MDEELETCLFGMEGRIVTTLKACVTEECGKVETTLKAHVGEECEKVETKLLTEFHKWASPSEARARSH